MIGKLRQYLLFQKNSDGAGTFYCNLIKDNGSIYGALGDHLDIQVKNPLTGVLLGVSRIDLSTEPKIWKYNSLVWYTLMSAYFRAHIFNFSYERFRPGRYIVNDTLF